MQEETTPSREALFATAYEELRRLARARFRDGGRNTFLGTTALIHEAYLRFPDVGKMRNDDRFAFFSYASRVMRSVIVDVTRDRQAAKRGIGEESVELDTQQGEQIALENHAGATEILQVHDAIESLAKLEPRQAKAVEMRYFGGYSENEIAEVLGVTERTVRRDWEKARLLILAMIQK